MTTTDEQATIKRILNSVQASKPKEIEMIYVTPNQSKKSRSCDEPQQAQRPAPTKPRSVPALHWDELDNIDESKCEQWLSARDKILDKSSDGFLVALIGNRGTGKTQMAVSIIWTALCYGVTIHYTLATEIMLEIRATYGNAATESELTVLQRFIRPELLIIDEITELASTDASARSLTYIIDKRYMAKKKTVLIGNVKSDRLQEHLGQSIIDRLIQTGGVIVCDWDSFRSKQN